MKAKVLMIAAALLMFAAVSFGQGGVDPYTFVSLTTTCAGTAPLPEGTIGYLYLDANSNGPDASDPIAPLCEDPANNCPTGPALTWSYNQVPINGDAMLGIPGAFYFDGYMNIYGTNLVPNRIYLTFYYPNLATWNTVGGVKWTSPIFQVGADFASIDVELNGWTCTTGQIVNLCERTQVVTFVPDLDTPTIGGFPQTPPQHACAQMCATGGATLIKVGPVANSIAHPRKPNIVITSNGCTGCTTPGTGMADIMALPTTYAWTFVTEGANTYAEATIHGTSDGCVDIMFDFLLPVEMGNVTVTPLDGKAEVKWNTRSESDLARFEVIRDGEVIGVREASNSATGAEYSFVDESAANGRIYTYELAVVGIDGSRDKVYSGKVAPNAMYAKPTEYALGQNFPNPFNPTTTISFDIVDTNPVTLMVYNANGQLVTTLLNNVSKNAGRYSINFDASNLTSGLYFYTVKVGNVFTSTKKMMLVK